MTAIILAAIALAVAGYALYCVRKAMLALAEFAGDDEEIEVEEVSQEVWLSDGEFYSADKDALTAAIPGAIAFCTYEGVPCAVMPGHGVVSLHKLLSGAGKVHAIKS